MKGLKNWINNEYNKGNPKWLIYLFYSSLALLILGFVFWTALTIDWFMQL